MAVDSTNLTAHKTTLTDAHKAAVGTAVASAFWYSICNANVSAYHSAVATALWRTLTIAQCAALYPAYPPANHPTLTSTHSAALWFTDDTAIQTAFGAAVTCSLSAPLLTTLS